MTTTLTAKSITLRNVLTGWKTTGMIEVGSVAAGTFDILSFDVVRPENGDRGWKVIDTNKTSGPVMVPTLLAAKQYIADRVNEKAAA